MDAALAFILEDITFISPGTMVTDAEHESLREILEKRPADKERATRFSLAKAALRAIMADAVVANPWVKEYTRFLH